MRDASSLILNVLLIGLWFAGIGVFWVLPIVLGVRWARRKGYSTLWMLFGIHPIGAWIAAAILQYLPARTRCLHCHQQFNQQFKRCPFCEAPNTARRETMLPVSAKSFEPPVENPTFDAGAEILEPTPSLPPVKHVPPVRPSQAGALAIALAILAVVLFLGCSGVATMVILMRAVRTEIATPPMPEPMEWTEGDDTPPIFREFRSSGKVVPADAALEVGQLLHGEWAGTWYLVEVREVLPNGNVKVHWSDWHHDEILPRTRLQFPPPD